MLKTSCGMTLEVWCWQEEFTVELQKSPGGGLGFTVVGGVSTTGGCYVKAVVQDPALSDGRLRPGDRLIQVRRGWVWLTCKYGVEGAGGRVWRGWCWLTCRLGVKKGGGGCVHVCEVLLGVDSLADMGAFVCVHACEGRLGVTWPADGLCVCVHAHTYVCLWGGGAVAFFHYRWHCIDYPTLSRQTLSFSFVFLVSLCFVAIVSFLDFCCDWVWKNVFHAPQNGRNLISWLGRIILQQPAFPKESYWLSCGNSSELRHWNAPMHPIVLRSPCAVDRTLKTSY